MTQRILNRVIDPATGDELQLTGEDLGDGVVASDVVLRGNDGSIQGSTDNPLKVDGTLTLDGIISALSGDNIDVSKMSKGSLTVAHNAITSTATSTEIDCRGFNALKIHVTATGAEANVVDITVQDSPVSGGTFLDSYNENSAAQHKVTGIVTPGKSFIIKGIANYVKIIATITGTSTTTVSIIPLNI